MEKELAKRSHFCQKVIDKYNEQMRDLKKELQDIADGKRERKLKETEEEDSETELNNLKRFLENRINDIE